MQAMNPVDDGRRKKMSETNKTRPTTAANTYRQRRQTVDALLEELRGKLDAHAKRAEADPKNWGYAGDLGHVEEVLRDLAAFTR